MKSRISLWFLLMGMGLALISNSLLAQSSSTFLFDVPDFKEDDLETFFDAARNAEDKVSWRSIVEFGLADLRKSWEEKILDQLESSRNDYLGANPALSEAEKKQLELTLTSIREVAEVKWEAEALAIIQNEQSNWETDRNAEVAGAVLDEPEPVSLGLSLPSVDDSALSTRLVDIDTITSQEDFDGRVSEEVSKLRSEWENSIEKEMEQAREEWLMANPDAGQDDLADWDKEAQRKADEVRGLWEEKVAGQIATIQDNWRRGVQDDIEENLETWEEAMASFQGAKESWEEEIDSQIALAGESWDGAQRDLTLLRNGWRSGVEGAIDAGERVWAQAEDRLRMEREVWGSRIEEEIADGESEWESIRDEMKIDREKAEVRMEALISVERNRWKDALDSSQDILLADPGLDFDELARSYRALAEYYSGLNLEDGDYNSNIYTQDDADALSGKYKEFAEEMERYKTDFRRGQEEIAAELAYFIATGKVGTTDEIAGYLQSGNLPSVYEDFEEGLATYYRKADDESRAESLMSDKEKSRDDAWIIREEARVAYETADTEYSIKIGAADEAYLSYRGAQDALDEVSIGLGLAEGNYTSAQGSHTQALQNRDDALIARDQAQENYNTALTSFRGETIA